jgi:NCAIR mutase (PurE)-related protein
MDTSWIKNILEMVKDHRMDINEAMTQLKNLPYQDMGFAKIDNHRLLRTGVPEVIFCKGKAPEQVKAISEKLAETNFNILATRAEYDTYEKVREIDYKCTYDPVSKLIVVNPRQVEKIGWINILCAGTADIPVAEEAAITAESLGNYVNRIYDVGVAGIHRLFDHAEELEKARVNVVVAGMDGALASVVVGLVSSPVIAVPTSIGYGASFMGLSALLCMLNSCAPGVSVVNIDNGFGAGYQANLINHLILFHGVKSL